jgi:hypothetical protein
MITRSNSLFRERDAQSSPRRPTSRHVRFRAFPRSNRIQPTAHIANRCATSSTTAPRVSWPWPPWQCFFPGASLLRETQRHVDAKALTHGHLGRAEAFPRGRILDVGIRNPGKHFLSLGEHFLGRGIQGGKNLDGYASTTNVSSPRSSAPVVPVSAARDSPVRAERRASHLPTCTV